MYATVRRRPDIAEPSPPSTSARKHFITCKHARGSNRNAPVCVTDSVILRSLPPFRERGGTWERAGTGGGVVVVVRWGGWGFWEWVGVFSFSSPTGAAYLLGVVLMHCVGL